MLTFPANKRLLWILLGIILLLSIPMVAMQFTGEVNWTGTDFWVAGALLLFSGLLIELVLRNIKTMRNRLLLCGAILLILFLVWVELAVGIFGSPFAGS